MALDILHDYWGPYTHTEVENALKAYLSGLEDRINRAIQSGGVGLTDLSEEVQALLNKANTALQSETDPTVPNWAKQSNKPTYNVSEIIYSSNRPLSSKLDEMTAEILAAGATDSEMSDSSKKPVQNNVVKAYVDAAVLTLQNALNALMNGQSVTDAIDTFNEVKAFLDGIDTDDPTLANQLLALNNAISALQTSLAAKANAADVYTKSEVDTKVAEAGSGAVSVTTNQDGTFVIHVGETDYTINLNHTHENMAKLVVCEESGLPSTLAKDTIYAQVDDAESPTEIQSLWIAGLEFVGGGGGEPDYTPKLTSPRKGATIDFDGQSTVAIVVKGRNLTSNLSVVVTGDFTVTANGQSVSTIAAADVTDGASVSLLLTKGNDFVGGTIVIRSADLDEDVTLSITDSSELVALTGVKFTGTQWLETDYKANTKTEFILRCKLETNSITGVLDNVNRKNWILGGNDAGGCYELYHVSRGNNAPYNLAFDINTLGTSASLLSNSTNMLTDPLIIQYSKTSGKLTAGNASTNVTAKTGINTANLRICCRLTNGEDICYSRFYMTIYEFSIIEDGVNVRHYIPMRRFGSPGLYDTVTGSFLTSKTNDPLVEVNS